MLNPTQKNKDRKTTVWNNLVSAVNKYNKCLFVNVDNVTSKQICIMRKALREIDAQMVMGKNTLMRTCIRSMQAEDKKKGVNRPHLQLILDQFNLNVGMIFSNGDLQEVKKIIDSQKREAPAKIGALANADVTVPAGPTGMDPKQTQFFQALNIQTKIVKGQVEIVNPVKVINDGDKITPGQAVLLDKLKIRPFEYKMWVLKVLDNGALFPPKVLDITTDSILESFTKNAQNVTALSLGSGFVTAQAAQHLVINAFKNLAAAGMGAGFSFKQAEALVSAASNAVAAPVASAPQAAASSKKAEVKKEESEEEMDMGDFFG